VIYPNDHRPAHVHVIGSGQEVVFDLHCLGGPPELRENYEFNTPELTRIEAALAADLPVLCGRWEQIHGEP